MCRFVHRTLKDSRGPHSLVIDSLISLALRHSMTPPLETEAGSCSGMYAGNVGIKGVRAHSGVSNGEEGWGAGGVGMGMGRAR